MKITADWEKILSYEKMIFSPAIRRMTSRHLDQENMMITTNEGMFISVGVAEYTCFQREDNISVMATALRLFRFINYSPNKIARSNLSLMNLKVTPGANKYQCILTDP